MDIWNKKPRWHPILLVLRCMEQISSTGEWLVRLGSRFQDLPESNRLVAHYGPYLRAYHAMKHLESSKGCKITDESWQDAFGDTEAYTD